MGYSSWACPWRHALIDGLPPRRAGERIIPRFAVGRHGNQHRAPTRPIPPSRRFHVHAQQAGSHQGSVSGYFVRRPAAILGVGAGAPV